MAREPSTGRSVATSSLSTDHWLASDVYKADVYDPFDHKIGKVTDLMIDSNGKVTGAIIGVGGHPGDRITVRATRPARLMLLGGAALEGPRYIWWNFVSSRRERIEQAKEAWKTGKFAPVPGETEFIPLQNCRAIRRPQQTLISFSSHFRITFVRQPL